MSDFHANWGKTGRNALVVAMVSILTTLGAALPAWAGPPFRTDDPEPVEYQHWEVYAFSTATDAKGDTAGILPGVEINYGAAPDLQLHVIAPVAFDAPGAGATQFGYGDTELGVKYRFIQEDENGWHPQIGVFPLLEVPTGDAEKGLGTGHAHEFLPIWLQKSWSDWTTYGGGGYWINPGGGNKNYWFAGWLLQRQVTKQLALGGELFTRPPTPPAVATAPDSTLAASTISTTTIISCSLSAAASSKRPIPTAFRITSPIS